MGTSFGRGQLEEIIPSRCYVGGKGNVEGLQALEVEIFNINDSETVISTLPKKARTSKFTEYDDILGPSSQLAGTIRESHYHKFNSTNIHSVEAMLETMKNAKDSGNLVYSI